MNILKTVIAASALAVWGGVASAATLLAVIDGNDPFPGALVVGGVETPALYKCDVSGRSCSDSYTSDSTVGSFSVTFDSGDNGTWSWSGSGLAGDLAPSYMAVKAGNAYALWDLMGDTSGLWDTGALNGRDLSHLSFYDTGNSTVIPLPAAGFLLLAGLGGLALVRRRK